MLHECLQHLGVKTEPRVRMSDGAFVLSSVFRQVCWHLHTPVWGSIQREIKLFDGCTFPMYKEIVPSLRWLASNWYVVASPLPLSCIMGEVISTKLHLLFIQFCKYATKWNGISHVLRSKGKNIHWCHKKKTNMMSLGENPMSMHSRTEPFS